MRIPVYPAGEGNEALRKRIGEEIARRGKFLVKLYEETKADVGSAVRIEKLANPIGLDGNEANRVASYLEECGQVKGSPPIRSGTSAKVTDVYITAKGIDTVEQMVMEDKGGLELKDRFLVG